MSAAALERQLLELDRQYREAMKSGDAEALQELTADPCLVVGAQGVVEFEPDELTEMMSGQDFHLKSYNLDEENVEFRRLGDGAASIAYRVQETYERSGKPYAADAYNCSIWVKDGDSWTCAVHTESLVGPPR
jgi:ketosteroid isomerase-like protein